VFWGLIYFYERKKRLLKKRGLFEKDSFGKRIKYDNYHHDSSDIVISLKREKKKRVIEPSSKK
jgi:hypothetical protein